MLESATFVRPGSVTSCVYAHAHLLKHLEARLGDNCFNLLIG